MEMCKTLKEIPKGVGQGLVGNHKVIELSHCGYQC